jgi:predicted HTH domain antitoxin
MNLALPESIEKGRSPAWAALHLAIGLYVSREVSLGKAAEVAGLAKSDFQRELAQRKIPLNYSLRDLEVDLQAVRELTAK